MHTHPFSQTGPKSSKYTRCRQDHFSSHRVKVSSKAWMKGQGWEDKQGTNLIPLGKNVMRQDRTGMSMV